MNGYPSVLDGKRAFIYENNVDPTPFIPGGGVEINMPRFSQTVAVHEFGHLLGLFHPGDLLKPPPRDTYKPDSASLMGNGSDLRGHYFDRWVNYLNKEYKDYGPWKAEFQPFHPLGPGTYNRWQYFVAPKNRGILRLDPRYP